jgi:predicted ATPase/DNA-binding CsgD family transcriptional regulator/Tfp pilus assembly protein PilF
MEEAPRGRASWLPTPVTSFLGRAAALDRVHRALRQNRLVTITGVGGAGKSRLAIEVARRFSNQVDAVCFVDLTPVGTAAGVEQAIAVALDVREGPSLPLFQAITLALRERATLLLLDNCEHLIDVCADLANALLLAAPGLRVLATSREPLGITGERRIVLRGFDLPALDWEGAEPFPEAVQLFVERAQEARGEFSVTSANAAVIARICRRLDGIALALELAAARTPTFSVDQIAERLDDRFRLLVGARSTGFARHRTLWAAIDWSYALLPEAEQRALRRLAIFAGPFRREAAEAIIDGPPDGPDFLANLELKSLVQSADAPWGEVQFRLLESIRAYALERLQGAGERARAVADHRRWYLGWVGRVFPSLFGPGQAQTLDLLAAERDNLRAVLAGCREDGDIEDGLRFANQLTRFWRIRGFMAEGRAFLSDLLGAEAEPPIELRAWAMTNLAELARAQGDRTAAITWAGRALDSFRAIDHAAGKAAALTELGFGLLFRGERTAASERLAEAMEIRARTGESSGLADTLYATGLVRLNGGDARAAELCFRQVLAIHRKTGDIFGILNGLAVLGQALRPQGEVDVARSAYEESLELAQQIGNLAGIATTENSLANLLIEQGDYAGGTARLELARQLYVQIGDRAALGSVVHNLGLIARLEGDYPRSSRLLEQALALRQEEGSPRGGVLTLQEIGLVALERRATTRAADVFREALRIARQIEEQRYTIRLIEDFAEVALQAGNPTLATRWIAAASGARQLLGLSPTGEVQAMLERRIATAQALLTDGAFVRAWTDGQGCSIDQVVEEALAFRPTFLTIVATAPVTQSRTPLTILTRRQREVAVLIGEGLANREIAERLVVDVRTVETHVENIFNRLGVNSRTQLVRLVAPYLPEPAQVP